MDATVDQPRHHSFTSYNIVGSVRSMDCNLFTAILVLFFTAAFLFGRRIFAPTKHTPFPFMNLPPELREDIYNRITERTPTYPRDDEGVSVPRQRSRLSMIATWFSIWFAFLLSPLTGAFGIACAFIAQLFRDARDFFHFLRLRRHAQVSSLTPLRPAVASMGPLLAGRKLHFEYMAFLCRTTPFKLTIGDANSHLFNPWGISSVILGQIRYCNMQIKTTPVMMSPFNPNNAVGPWSVRDNIAQLIHLRMTNLKEVRLQIRAFGDQTWNPLRIWHYASQSFKEVGIHQLQRIEFKLDNTWPVLTAVNHLGRDSENNWVWKCSEDHQLKLDYPGWQPVRQFCQELYAECEICRGEASEGVVS